MSPRLSDEGLDAAIETHAVNQFGNKVEVCVAAERALTIYLNKREIVTLMTLGTQPELLTLGWLMNQRLLTDIHSLESIIVDWGTESVAVTTSKSVDDLDEKLSHKTVTTGCGQGAIYGNIMAEINTVSIKSEPIKQSMIYALLKNLSDYNKVYRQAGAVHGCALCDGKKIIRFVEDVGRHNAVDAIAGYMWLNNIRGSQRVFYTTGRLTSEMVIKVALMGIPVLLSRSGITHLGLSLAKQVGITLISRAKGRHFLVYSGDVNLNFDSIPDKR